MVSPNYVAAPLWVFSLPHMVLWVKAAMQRIELCRINKHWKSDISFQIASRKLWTLRLSFCHGPLWKTLFLSLSCRWNLSLDSQQPILLILKSWMERKVRWASLELPLVRYEMRENRSIIARDSKGICKCWVQWWIFTPYLSYLQYLTRLFTPLSWKHLPCLTFRTPHSLGFTPSSLVTTSQFLLLVFPHLPPSFYALQAPKAQSLDPPLFHLCLL